MPTYEQPEPPYTQVLRSAMSGKKRLSEVQLDGLFDTKLMVTATEFKWQAYGRRLVAPHLLRWFVTLRPTRRLGLVQQPCLA